jgi:hypothetical protein
MDLHLLYKLHIGPCRKAKLAYEVVPWYNHVTNRAFSRKQYYFYHRIEKRSGSIWQIKVFDKEFDIHGQPLDTVSRG